MGAEGDGDGEAWADLNLLKLLDPMDSLDRPTTNHKKISIYHNDAICMQILNIIL